MSVEFLLHNAQRASVDKSKSIITFETECLNGTVYYFHLSYDQFLALDDAITLICKGSRNAHYPLGQKLWLHYFYVGAVIYDNMKHGQPYFKFENFELYKRRIHRRLMSFIRRGRNGNVSGHAGDAIRQRGESSSGRLPRWRTRRRQQCEESDESESEFPNSKRPLSVVLQPSHQSARTEKTYSMCGTSSRSTDNAVMSHPEETSSVLSERDYSNSCRWNDSLPVLSNFSGDISPPPTIDFGDYSFDTMDCQ